jgi:hypothetical protein
LLQLRIWASRDRGPDLGCAGCRTFELLFFSLAAEWRSLGTHACYFWVCLQEKEEFQAPKGSQFSPRRIKKRGGLCDKQHLGRSGSRWVVAEGMPPVLIFYRPRYWERMTTPRNGRLQCLVLPSTVNLQPADQPTQSQPLPAESVSVSHLQISVGATCSSHTLSRARATCSCDLSGLRSRTPLGVARQLVMFPLGAKLACNVGTFSPDEGECHVSGLLFRGVVMSKESPDTHPRR